MKTKFYITGPSGSGKTYLAQRLAKRLDIAPTDIDDLWLKHGGKQFYHRPPWYRRTVKAELQESILRELQLIMSSPGWIIDNNYDFAGEFIASRADVAVILELPLFELMTNTWVRHRSGEKRRQGYTTLDFWLYGVTAAVKLRAKRRVARQTTVSAKSVIRLRSRAELEAFLATI